MIIKLNSVTGGEILVNTINICCVMGYEKETSVWFTCGRSLGVKEKPDYILREHE